MKKNWGMITRIVFIYFLIKARIYRWATNVSFFSVPLPSSPLKKKITNDILNTTTTSTDNSLARPNLRGVNDDSALDPQPVDRKDIRTRSQLVYLGKLSNLRVT